MPNFSMLLGELRYAARNLRKATGFTAIALLTLAVGIGASTAVFTVVDSVILKPLAFADSGALVAVWERVRFLGYEPDGPNPRHAAIWRERSTAFRQLTVLQYRSLGVATDRAHPRLTAAAFVLPNFFETLGVTPLMGRGFVPDDGVKGRDNVAVLSWRLWQSEFHADPSVLGKSIRVDDVPRKIVGVLPAGFHFPDSNALRASHSRQPVSGVDEPALFIPAALDYSQMEWNGNYGNWIVLGRLEPGVSIGQAEAQLNAIQAQVSMEMPAGHGDHRPDSLRASIEPMQEAVVGDSRSRLTLLLAAVLGLMLIGCLNLANAQLARALARRREAALRAALGASKWQIVWSGVAENLLLAAGGGAAGIALAYAALSLLRKQSAVDLPRLAEVRLNPGVLAFAFGLMLAAALISGLLPALRVAFGNPSAALHQSGSRSLGSRQGSRAQTFLIAVQVFGCTALLLVTGLFARSLLNLLSEKKGFETAHTAVAEVRLNFQSYDEDQRRVAFDDGVLQNLRQMAGVQSAGLVSAMPLDGESWIEAVQPLDDPRKETPLINFRWVSPGYFEATGQRLVAGRFLEERDRNLKSVVLSQLEAKALWGAQDPIGRGVQIEGRKFTVVGVVADSRNTSLKTPPARMAYAHYTDRPPFPTYFIVRSAAPIESLLAGMRQAIWRYDPNVTIARVKTLDAQVSDSLASERFQTLALVSFGAAALLLAMLGIYGVLNYAVAARKQEIGVRMALGASRARVYALTFAQAGAPVLAGLVAGLLASAFAEKLVRNLLYGIKGSDAVTVLGVAGLFLIAAAAAAFLPARRAASIDPMDALRSE